MAVYGDLTAQQKALVDNWANNLRASLGSMARLVQTSELLAAQYNQEVVGLSLTGDIPNNGGLSGASVEEDMTQMVTWQSYLNTLVSTLGTSGHIDQYVSAAGPDNVTGG